MPPIIPPPRIRAFLPLHSHLTPPRRKIPPLRTPHAFHRHNSNIPVTTTPPPPPSLSPLSESLRNSMRLLPHPVVVLTSLSSGITLSTLTCLSLHPHALITFNIKTPSATSRAIHAHDSFVIHILRSSPHSAHIANAFAQLATSPEKKRSPWSLLRGCVEKDAATGVPMLGKDDDVISRWRCERHKVVQVEDHEVWVGRVVGMEDLGSGGEGLMYQNRRFRRVGKEVVAEFEKPGEGVRLGEGEEEEGEGAAKQMV